MEEYVAKSILKKELNIANLHAGIIDALQNIVDEIPAADVEEVKHGEWIVIKYQNDIDSCLYEKYKCSVCGAIEYRKYKYCHCGAKKDLTEVE